MAPSSSEPRQILVVLNPARRKALYHLVSEITAYMRTQLELQKDTDNAHSGDHTKAFASLNLGSQTTLPGYDAPESTDSSALNGSEKTAKPDISVSQRHTPPSPGLVALRKAALVHYDEWRKVFQDKLKELNILSTTEDAKILEARQKRKEKMDQLKVDSPSAGEDLIDFGFDEPTQNKSAQDTAKEVEALQAIYHPIPTRLASIPVEDRKEVLSAILILLLSTGNYSAYSHAFITYLCSAFELVPSFLAAEEKEIAKTMIEASTEAAEKAKKDGSDGAAMSAEAEAQKRKQQNQASRYWKVGLASVAGAAIIGVTGGLAAPVVAGAIGGIMGSVGLGGLASFLGIFWMNGALVGTLFGAFGARMTGEMVDKYAREVEDFRFLPLKDEWGAEFRKEDKDIRRLRVTIGINGWLMAEDDVTKPWRALGDDTEAFALRYEMDSLLKLGHALRDMVASYAWNILKIEVLRRTVLATLWAAMWPLQIMKLAAGIDNPFNLAKNRSEKAGRILADALINKVQGERPVTLVGYSLGARVIYFCLKTLAERKAFGLVDTVVFIGAPVPSNRNHWQMMRSVVAGKMFNVYSENDYILAFLYRATSIQLGIAGLQAVEDIEGVENIDLSQQVLGHLRYSGLIAQILRRCGFADIRGGEGPIEKEKTDDEIKLQDLDYASGEGVLLDFDTAPDPIVVKPLGKKVHREISFPSGLHKEEERPVVRKVSSSPASGGLGPRQRNDDNSQGSPKVRTISDRDDRAVTSSAFGAAAVQRATSAAPLFVGGAGHHSAPSTDDEEDFDDMPRIQLVDRDE